VTDSISDLPEEIMVEGVSGLRKYRILRVVLPEKRVQRRVCRPEKSAQWPVDNQKSRQPPCDVPAATSEGLNDALDVLPAHVCRHGKVRKQGFDGLLDYGIGPQVGPKRFACRFVAGHGSAL
jgi:hypothetical protein